MIGYQNGLLSYLYEGSGRYEEPYPYGILYHRPGGAPTNDRYELTEIGVDGSITAVVFEWYDSNLNDCRDEDDLYIHGEGEVSRVEWEAFAEPLLAVPQGDIEWRNDPWKNEENIPLEAADMEDVSSYVKWGDGGAVKHGWYESDGASISPEQAVDLVAESCSGEWSELRPNRRDGRDFYEYGEIQRGDERHVYRVEFVRDSALENGKYEVDVFLDVVNTKTTEKYSKTLWRFEFHLKKKEVVGMPY